MKAPGTAFFGPVVRFLARPGWMPARARKIALNAVSWLWGHTL